MTPFGIAGIQMNLQHGSNVDAIEDKINVLMSLYPWVEMVIISELAAHGPLHSYAEPMPGHTEDRFCAMAQKHNIWLIPGSFFEQRNNAVFNTTPVINPQGQVIARHRKLFPFCPFEEGVEAGDEFVVFDVPGAGRFGLCICYDMWFPEVLRTLTSMGAEVILHPILTGTNDREIELNLARSSGAIFQSYIIDINGLGVGGVGQSCFVDPSGRVIHQAGTTDEFLVTELDFDMVRRQREVGLRNLGQPLKSFRDSKINFTVYNKEQRQNSYLDSLGPLQKPTRESKARMATVPGLTVNNDVANTDVAEPLIHHEIGELGTYPDAAEYGNLAIDHATEIPSAAIEQQTQLNLTTAAKKTLDLSAMTKVTESVKMESDKNSTVSESGNGNLKWLKEASAQFKQYIKS
ncbi:hypothetical protein A9Q98_14200 [Thalassotalea sp. 42_200_T64]|nr:hypothetical protein A9Q98_14200 [Thalassotalea sp. 42_200_T64]